MLRWRKPLVLAAAFATALVTSLVVAGLGGGVAAPARAAQASAPSPVADAAAAAPLPGVTSAPRSLAPDGPVVGRAHNTRPAVVVSPRPLPAPSATAAADGAAALARSARSTTAPVEAVPVQGAAPVGEAAAEAGALAPAAAPPAAQSSAPAPSRAAADPRRAAPAVDADRSFALLVGVDHYANARDLSTAVADTTALGDVLLEAGWRPDHLRVLADPDAAAIRQGLEWLAANADDASTVVVSYSGHTRQRDGDPDGDGEGLDEGWWTADGDVVWDAEIGQRLGAIRAGRLWLTVQACEAGGYDDPGTLGPGRLVTWSSLEEEKSFEDLHAGFSTQSHRLVVEGLRDGQGDGDGDGSVSVQEAAAWSTPLVQLRTDGRQSPQVHDELGGPLLLDAR